MDLVPSICISSLAGAIFFFTGGRLSARAPRLEARPGPELDEERAGRARAEEDAALARRALEEERAAREDAEARATALQAARDELATRATALQAARDELAARTTVLGTELGQARASSAAGAGEIQRARAAVEAAERRVAELGRDLGKARADLGKAQEERRRLAADLAARADGPGLTAQRVAELTAMGAENAALRAAHAALLQERAAAPDPAELQRRSVELTFTARALGERAEEMDRREAEHAELRVRLEELSAVAHEAEELRLRVAELTALGFARRLEAPAPPSRPPPEGASLATVLERELGRLVDREEGCRLAVLADPRGLLIAASPNASYPEEVAAASSLTIYASDRLRELIPLGAPASLEVYDGNGLCVRTRWLYFEDECFLVSTIGVIDPSDAEADMLRSRLGDLVAGGARGAT